MFCFQYSCIFMGQVFACRYITVLCSFVSLFREAKFCGVPSCVFDKIRVCRGWKRLRNTALELIMHWIHRKLQSCTGKVASEYLGLLLPWKSSKDKLPEHLTEVSIGSAWVGGKGNYTFVVFPFQQSIRPPSSQWRTWCQSTMWSY
jgi:hypothetical protein